MSWRLPSSTRPDPLFRNPTLFRCETPVMVAFNSVPMVSRAQVTAMTSGDGWLEKGANLILFGPPGGGQSHLAAAIGLQLVQNGWRVLFTRTSELVQQLQLARRELALESAIATLDKYHLPLLHDPIGRTTRR